VGLGTRQVHAMNATMMELSREMMKAGIIDEVRPIVVTACQAEASPPNSYARSWQGCPGFSLDPHVMPAQMMTDSIDSALDTDEMEDETEAEVEKVTGRR